MNLLCALLYSNMEQLALFKSSFGVSRSKQLQLLFTIEAESTILCERSHPYIYIYIHIHTAHQHLLLISVTSIKSGKNVSKAGQRDTAVEFGTVQPKVGAVGTYAS